ncbi:hypothetical protein GX48_06504 [Paracoccidioides brasiliensis]|nr:hypothetical protein GX48_06504 [Paracoccidioides brasiliensis]
MTQAIQLDGMKPSERALGAVLFAEKDKNWDMGFQSPSLELIPRVLSILIDVKSSGLQSNKFLMV